MKRSAVAILLGTCACGGGASSPDGGSDGGGPPPLDAGPGAIALCQGRGGDRLKLPFYEPEPGVRQELGIYDSQLDTECSFEQVADDTFRCLPRDAGGTLYFTDAGCTEPIVGFAGAPSRFHRQYPPACSNDHRLWSVGAAINVVNIPDTVFQGSPANCTPILRPALEFFQATAMAADDFVEGAPGLWGEGSRVRHATYEGGDGSFFCDLYGPFRDTELAASCVLSWDSEHNIRCIVRGLSAQTYFSDDQCTVEETAGVGASCQSDEPYIVSSTDGACAPLVQVFASGASDNDALRYQRAGDLCVVIDDSDRTVVPMGDAVDEGIMAPATREFETENVRLQRGIMWVGGQLPIFRSQFFDSKLDAACSFERAADGEMRCLPEGRTPGNLFTDDQCTEAITLVPIRAGCEEFSIQHLREPLEGGGIRIRALGDAYAGVLYSNSGFCGQVPDDGTIYYRLAHEMGPTSFQAVERQLE